MRPSSALQERRPSRRGSGPTLREAIRRADAGDFEGARSVLAGAAEDLRQGASAAGSSRSSELLAQAADLESSDASMSRPDYDAHARKLLRYRSLESGERPAP